MPSCTGPGGVPDIVRAPAWCAVTAGVLVCGEETHVVRSSPGRRSPGLCSGRPTGGRPLTGGPSSPFPPARWREPTLPMSRVTPRLRRLSHCLIACETRENPSSAPAPSASNVCERLRPPLATLVGNAGFQALLSRALMVAAVEAAWLQAVRANANGTLEWVADTGAPPGSREVAEGSVILVAQLLGLLTAFVGETLTLRMLREVWPELSVDGIGFTIGNKNEEEQ